MSPVERLLLCLDGVRETGPGQWLARCPAHDDNSPSLSIRDVEDRVLVNCFAGCSGLEVVQATGMNLADLYDQPLSHHATPSRSRISAKDRLAAIDHEAIIVALAATQLANGEPLAKEDRERLLVAARRIGEARDHG